MPFEKELQDLEKRKTRALEMGGREKIEKQHAKGRLSARERIQRLLDPDSFFEVGMFNHSDVPGMEEQDPGGQQNRRLRDHRWSYGGHPVQRFFRSGCHLKPRGRPQGR